MIFGFAIVGLIIALLGLIIAAYFAWSSEHERSDAVMIDAMIAVLGFFILLAGLLILAVTGIVKLCVM